MANIDSDYSKKRAHVPYTDFRKNHSSILMQRQTTIELSFFLYNNIQRQVTAVTIFFFTPMHRSDKLSVK